MTVYIKSKKFSKGNNNRGLIILSVLAISAVVCSLVFYLFQTSKIVSHSYQIREQKELIKELETKNQKLESQIARWRSPANLENLVQSLGMIETKGAIYLKNGKAVAVRD
ncbi:MAG: hypothetical protein U9P63_01425 [Patescibacteria group bacterium]|nr:hypothetical protein [Patescibacteria group bacterium]